MKPHEDYFIPPLPAEAEFNVRRVKELETINAELLVAMEGAGEALELAMAVCSMPTFTGAPKADAESFGLWQALQDISAAIAKAKAARS
jgi:hypothetical protein